MAEIANTGTGGTEQRSNARADQQLRSILFDSVRCARMTREDVARRMTQREVVAARMSAISGTVITLNVLNNYLAPSRDTARMPAILLPAFCQACGDDRALRFLLGKELLKILELGECVAALLNVRPELQSSSTESCPEGITSPADDREELRA